MSEPFNDRELRLTMEAIAEQSVNAVIKASNSGDEIQNLLAMIQQNEITNALVRDAIEHFRKKEAGK